MRVAVHTLGCKLNYAESSTIAREFALRGYEVVPSTSEADIYVVNTCSVTEHSDKKDRNLIRRLHRRSPGALIAVVGCYAQLRGEEIAALEGVDIVLGARNKGLVVDEVERLLAAGGRGKAPQRVEICDIDSVEYFPRVLYGGENQGFPQDPGRLRLQMLLLHCPLCPRRQPEPSISPAVGTGPGDSRFRHSGDSPDRGQYRGLRA